MANKFRNDMGAALTRALFLESCEYGKDNALYSLSREDVKEGRKTYPSIHKLYSLYDNPTEYDFAVAHFESYKHWLTIREAVFFQSTYEEMRANLEARIASEAVKKIKQMDGFQPQKWLAEKGYVDKPTAGRPSKESIEGEKKKVLAKDKQLVADLAKVRQLAQRNK